GRDRRRRREVATERPCKRQVNLAFALAPPVTGPPATASLKIAPSAVSQKLRLGKKGVRATLGQSLVRSNWGSVRQGSRLRLILSACGRQVKGGTMRRTGVAGCALALGVLLGTGAIAQADDETGVAGIHDWVKIGRKTCFVDHFHNGSGNGKT